MAVASSKQSITSLLTEHLRYTPLTLLDDIINTVNELVYRAVSAVEEGLNSASPPSLGFADEAAAEDRTPEKDPEGHDVYPEAKVEVEEGVHKLETLLEATLDKNFDKLEIYVLRNILSVPEEVAPYMRLGHYENLDVPASSTTATATPESLFILRRKAQESQKLRQALLLEHERNAALLSSLRALLSADSPSPSTPSFAFLTADPAATTLGVSPDNSNQPLTTHTSFALSQLPALRTLLRALRPQLFAMHQKQRPLRPESDEAAERREYIDARARRMLERDGVDVEAGQLGAGGRAERVGAEGVAAIEGMVKALGADGGRAAGRARAAYDEMET